MKGNVENPIQNLSMSFSPLTIFFSSVTLFRETMEPLNPLVNLIERVVTMRKVYVTTLERGGVLQINDNNGIFGDNGLIYVEGARWVHDNLLLYAERV